MFWVSTWRVDDQEVVVTQAGRNTQEGSSPSSQGGAEAGEVCGALADWGRSPSGPWMRQARLSGSAAQRLHGEWLEAGCAL